MDIQIIFKVLLRRWWILLSVPLFAAAIAFYFTWNAPKSYLSTAQLSTGFTTNDQISLNDDQRFNVREADIKFSNLLQSLKSDLVNNLVSYKLIIHDLTSEVPFKRPPLSEGELPLTLEQKNEYTQRFQEKLKTMTMLSNTIPEDEPLIELLKKYGYGAYALQQSLNIKRIKDTDYITIDFLSRNPQMSAFVVNTLSEQFIRYYNTSGNAQINETVDFFQKLADQKKEELDAKAEKLKSFKAENGLLNVSIEGESQMSQTTVLETQREVVKNDIYRLTLSINNINSQLKELGVDTGKPGNTSASAGRIMAIRNKINAMNTRYIQGGAQNEALLDSITSLRAQLNTELMKSTPVTSPATGGVTSAELIQQRAEFEIELSAKQSSLNSINNQISSLLGNRSSYASKEATITALEREVNIAQEEYLQAQRKLNDSQNEAMISTSSIKQTAVGEPSMQPVSSNIVMKTGLAGFASFALCVFVIVFIELIDVSIKTPSQFEKLTGLTLAGSLNLIDSKKLNLAELFERINTKGDLETFKHFLRKLRYEVEESQGKIIMVTSTKAGEGKTFLILSMAYTLSLLNKRILIIDTNFKNNALTRMLAADGGASFYLDQGRHDNRLAADNNETFKEPKSPEEEEKENESFISRTAHKGIDIIVNHGGDDSPAEILAGKNFESLIKRLGVYYDYIFMEGASMNEYSDTKELVRYVDKVMPIFAADENIKQLDKESIKYLKSLNGKLMGGVLNKVKLSDLTIS